MITRADIRIIANSFTRDPAIRYVYCSQCNSATASIIKLTIRTSDFHGITAIRIPFVLSPVCFLVVRFLAILPKHIVPHTGNREGIEACAIATKHCRDGDDDVPGMSGFGTGNRRGWVSVVVSGRKWGKLAKITRK